MAPDCAEYQRPASAGRLFPLRIIWTLSLASSPALLQNSPDSANHPSGLFALRPLGIVGAFVAIYLGQALAGTASRRRRRARRRRRSARSFVLVAYGLVAGRAEPFAPLIRAKGSSLLSYPAPSEVVSVATSSWLF